MARYYVIRNHQRLGPYTIAELAADASVNRGTEVVVEGLAGTWRQMTVGTEYVSGVQEILSALPTDRQNWSGGDAPEPGSESEAVTTSATSRARPQHRGGLGVSNLEMSVRLRTTEPLDSVQEQLRSQFATIATRVLKAEDGFVVTGIDGSTLGSINREDSTHIEVKPTGDGCVVIATVRYAPSVWFWVFFVLTIFTAIGWVIPLAFFLMQKQTIQAAIERVFSRIKDELDSAPGPMPVAQTPAPSSTVTDEMADLDVLEKLAALHEKGILTEEEFQAKKAEILNRSRP